MTTPGLEREVRRRLDERDIRYTRGRKKVVTALAAANGPRSASELHAEIGEKVPLSSLYRTLSVLEDAGILVPHYATKGVTRYELAEWLQGHHHHLVCIDCGAVEDFSLPEKAEATVEELVTAVGRSISFLPTNHALEIEGRCSRCA